MQNNIKKLVSTLALATLIAGSLGTPGLAKAQEIPDMKALVQTFKQYPDYHEPLINSARPFKVYFVSAAKGTERVDTKFTYPIKVLNNRASFAIRDVEKFLNVQLEWENQNRLVVANNNDSEGKVKQVVYPIDKRVYAADGTVKTMDTSATIDRAYSRTYLPIRSISETLGYQIEFVTKEGAVWVGDENVNLKKAIQEEEKKNPTPAPKPTPAPSPQPSPNVDKSADQAKQAFIDKLKAVGATDAEIDKILKDNPDRFTKKPTYGQSGTSGKGQTYSFKLKGSDGTVFDVNSNFIPYQKTGYTEFVPIDGPIIDASSTAGNKSWSWFEQNYPEMAKAALNQNPFLKNYTIKVVTPTTKLGFDGGYAYPVVTVGNRGFNIMSPGVTHGQAIPIGTSTVLNADGKVVTGENELPRDMNRPKAILFDSAVLSNYGNVTYLVDYSQYLK